MTSELDRYEIEMLEEQKLIGECLRGLLLLKTTGWPAVDDRAIVGLTERWNTFEAFRGKGW